jgi:ankyrin repeat protein
VPWCRQNFGDLDPLAGNRRCAAAPSEVSVWAFHNRSRRPKDSVDLRKWISRHPGRINDQYDAFCDTPLHLAARFGRADLAEALVAAALNFASGPKIDPILSAPMMPGFFLAMLLGVRGGPDGMPSIVYVFGLSFLSWWIAIDLVWRIWRWVANPR